MKRFLIVISFLSVFQGLCAAQPGSKKSDKRVRFAPQEEVREYTLDASERGPDLSDEERKLLEQEALKLWWAVLLGAVQKKISFDKYRQLTDTLEKTTLLGGIALSEGNMRKVARYVWNNVIDIDDVLIDFYTKVQELKRFDHYRINHELKLLVGMRDSKNSIEDLETQIQDIHNKIEKLRSNVGEKSTVKRLLKRKKKLEIIFAYNKAVNQLNRLQKVESVHRTERLRQYQKSLQDSLQHLAQELDTHYGL